MQFNHQLLTCVVWMDLTGIGRLLAGVGYDTSRPEAKEVIAYISYFQEKLRSTLKAGRIDCYQIFLNDGAVICFDLRHKRNETVFNFVGLVFDLHNEIRQYRENRDDFDIRSIIAVGLRLKGFRPFSNNQATLYELIRQAETNELTICDAILKAASMNMNLGRIPQLQANFAFTKAIMADEAGSGEGFRVGGCYIDTHLLAEKRTGLTLGNNQKLVKGGVTGEFAELVEIDRPEVLGSKFECLKLTRDIRDLYHNPDLIG